MQKVRMLILLAATTSVALLSGCSGGNGSHSHTQTSANTGISGTYSDLSRATMMRFGEGRVQFGSAFGAIVSQHGGSDTGKYTVKGNTVTITAGTPDGPETMTLKIEKDGCLYSKDLKEELCKQK